MFVAIRYPCIRQFSLTRFYRVSSKQCSAAFSTHSSLNNDNQVPVKTLVNDQLFDKLVRKPYQREQYNPKHISNMKFTQIVLKHTALNTTLVVCSTLGACALCSHLNWISPSLLQHFNNASFFLNKLFPFLCSIGSEPMRYMFQLWSLICPIWISGSVGFSWLGCKLELNKLYEKYEKENEQLLIEEPTGFIQSCSLEDGCSMRFYGDECQHGNNRRFTKKSSQNSFYDGYGGNCSFKADKMK